MKQKFKNFLGIYILILHFSIILSLIYCRLNGDYIPEQFSTLLGISLPMFGGFAAAIIRYFVANQTQLPNSDTGNYTKIFRSLVCMLPGIFAGLIIFSIFAQSQKKVFSNFEDAKTFILSVESIFAVSCGVLIYSIFERDQAGQEASSQPRSSSELRD